MGTVKHQSEVLDEKQYEVYSILANHRRGTVESIMTISHLKEEEVKEQLESLLSLGFIVKNKTNDRYRMKKMWKQSVMPFDLDHESVV
jgi:predicted transcriptional regulator